MPYEICLMKTELDISVQVETNVNDCVYVRLTEEGKKYLKKHYFDNPYLPLDVKHDLFESYAKADEEGWSKFELFELMNIFGPIMYMGSLVSPFQGNVVRIGEREEEKIQIPSAD